MTDQQLMWNGMGGRGGNELLDFAKFCGRNPELRFWQALRAWSEASAILYDDGNRSIDTFYWEGKYRNENSVSDEQKQTGT